jgi:catechol 2,3-dioxygenase-like lactoylglutathione lyase family enzyme
MKDRCRYNRISSSTMRFLSPDLPQLPGTGRTTTRTGTTVHTSVAARAARAGTAVPRGRQRLVPREQERPGPCRPNRNLLTKSQRSYLYIKIAEGSGAVIHHVQLACPPGREPALREFYAGVLGLDELPKPPSLAARGGCWFRGYGMELHLGVEEDFRPARKAHPGLLVAGLDAWADRLREAGYPVLFDDEFPGMRRFYTQDPNGNRLEFLEPIPAFLEPIPAQDPAASR